MTHPGGRPKKYKKEYNDQVYKLCLLGATDKEIADFFNVTEQTVNNWKQSEPEFFEPLKRGKMEADTEIAKALYHRAKGYSHSDVHISNYQGEVTITPIVKHYPPDTGAAMAWLKNRQPDKWRDKQEIEHSGGLDNTNINIDAAALDLYNNPEIAEKVKAGTLSIADVKRLADKMQDKV